MRCAIAVHGRWDAFDIARELQRRGHHVTVLTNYPRSAVEEFGVSGQSVRSFLTHGVLSRMVARWGGPAGIRASEPALHRLFGRWASAVLQADAWDVICVFSGVAEESLRALERRSGLRLLMRESAHIRAQDRLLFEEELRTGVRQDRPSAWMIAREEREYALADAVRVLSSFAYRSFVAEGVPPAKLRLVVSGVQVEAFRLTNAQLEQRCQRILSGAPIRVLNVGTFAFRKGIWDSAAVINELGSAHFDFQFVGPVAAEAARLAADLRTRATFIPKQRQAMLPALYAGGDVFMLPTIEDGFAAVLAQAAAAGLPILTTPNGAGSDLVRDGQSGWILPIRSPHRFVDQLRWADAHRRELAEMVCRVHQQFRPRDFVEVAADFERLSVEQIGAEALSV